MNTQVQAGAHVCPAAIFTTQCCLHCGAALIGTRRKKFCNDEHRMLYHANRLKVARRARRAEYYQRRDRYRSFGFDGRYGGPIAGGVPYLGSLTLRLGVLCAQA